MDEFARIHTYLAPLAASEAGAFALQDDAASIHPPADHNIVITHDTLVETVHFRPTDAPQELAQKALRVNLSDLAAKAAKPWVYLLSLSLTDRCDDAWLEAFARGLALDQATYGTTLIGGDSTRHPSCITLSVTALGLCSHTQPMITRTNAKAGDAVFITGTVGDSALGVKVENARSEAELFVQNRYLLPQPRTRICSLLHAHATSAMDVSDGLLQDARHLATASNVEMILDLDHIPLSAAAQTLLPCGLEGLIHAATGGDDYEILFTAPASREAEIKAFAQTCGVIITRIGTVKKGAPALKLCHLGASIPLPERLGYRHTH